MAAAIDKTSKIAYRAPSCDTGAHLILAAVQTLSNKRTHCRLFAMLINSSESHLVSNLGWIDKGNLWVCETASAQVTSISLSEADYITLHPGEADTFAVVHNFSTERLEISAHNLTSPETALSRISFIVGIADFEGDPAVWLRLPRAYIVLANYLLMLDPAKHTAELKRLFWFDQSYDHTCQGIVGVTEVPGKELVIVSIQRDSEPVIYCPAEDQMVRKITLAGRSGSPVFRFRDNNKEVWVSDYDMMLRLNPDDWSIRDKIRLQWEPLDVVRFIGDFAFNRDQTLCAVARPFSGDVVALETTTFKVTHSANVGKQPFDVVLLADARVFARDWTTGNLLQGTLKTRRRWWFF